MITFAQECSSSFSFFLGNKGWGVTELYSCFPLDLCVALEQATPTLCFLEKFVLLM